MYLVQDKFLTLLINCSFSKHFISYSSTDPVNTKKQCHSGCFWESDSSRLMFWESDSSRLMKSVSERKRREKKKNSIFRKWLPHSTLFFWCWLEYCFHHTNKFSFYLFHIIGLQATNFLCKRYIHKGVLILCSPSFKSKAQIPTIWGV